MHSPSGYDAPGMGSAYSQFCRTTAVCAQETMDRFGLTNAQDAAPMMAASMPPSLSCRGWQTEALGTKYPTRGWVGMHTQLDKACIVCMEDDVAAWQRQSGEGSSAVV